MNEKITFSIVKTSHSTSTVFDGIDKRLVLAEFEGNGDESNQRVKVFHVFHLVSLLH